MTGTSDNSLPTGVRAIAALFALCGVYLAGAGLIILFRPGTISMTLAAPLLFGLELAGPYMFLLMAAVAGAIAWGLVQQVNLARHAAVLAAVAGVVMLVPPVSAAVVMVQPKSLALDGLAVIIRVIVAWYLSQGHIADQFKTSRRTG
jgi:ABC-type transport system involved in multi-copper enzyme maturation permease subunit